MHVLLIILGLLLLLFGGGCTLLLIGTYGSDPSHIQFDLSLILSLWLPLGLLPLVGGWFIFRHGLKIDRQKRKAMSGLETKP
jgi:hypothetical protein